MHLNLEDMSFTIEGDAEYEGYIYDAIQASVELFVHESNVQEHY